MTTLLFEQAADQAAAGAAIEGMLRYYQWRLCLEPEEL